MDRCPDRRIIRFSRIARNRRDISHDITAGQKKSDPRFLRRIRTTTTTLDFDTETSTACSIGNWLLSVICVILASPGILLLLSGSCFHAMS